MTRKAALTVRLPGARIAPAKSTWTCGHRRLENSGTKGFSRCSIVDGRVRIVTSLWRTGDDRTLPLLTLTKWTKSSALKLSEKSRRGDKRGLPKHRSGTIGHVWAPIYRPNPHSQRRSNPFSDSFLTEFSEVRTLPLCSGAHTLPSHKSMLRSLRGIADATLRRRTATCPPSRSGLATLPTTCH